VTEAVVGLGSNLGDRDAHLAEAVDALRGTGLIVVISSTYETAPVGGPEQGPFLNAVVVVETELGPEEMLDRLLAIEAAAGRVRGDKWGPRVIDLDLLLHGAMEIDIAGLRVPHPRMTERRFVLEPLLEVRPDASLPDGTRLDGFLPRVADQEVRRLAGPDRV
jgi:2-amino-4-hydroxy-6-hydroxymethyldihydropteridine diphosphokinase